MKQCLTCNHEVEDFQTVCPRCGGSMFVALGQDAANTVDGMQKRRAAVHHINRCGELYEQGRYADAERELRKALDIDPTHPLAHSNMGLVLYRQGRLDEAIEWVEKALELDPQIEGAPEALAQMKAEAAALRPTEEPAPPRRESARRSTGRTRSGISGRSLLRLIFLNLVLSVAVAVILISLDRARRPTPEPLVGPTQVKIVTATPVPGSENALLSNQYVSTIDALGLTVTALSQMTREVVMVTPTPGGLIVPSAPALATIDPALLPPIPTDLPPGLPSPTPQDDGCVRHTVESGDTVIAIAQRYGVLPGDILLANDMTEQDAAFLQVGDVLVIPVAGCMALVTPSPAPSPSNTPFELTRVAPTVTLLPTAVNAQIVIASVSNWGDVNNEVVELSNLGDTLNLQGWTLSNTRGESFRFPEFRMQPGSLVRVYTRQGSNTPAVLFWGRDRA
ncbi:MAG: tetratricopeptide repeat protein, partial [Anaerolineae bacterium]|nr:tetratricopeptide repeat protein [Anaerolineae bacterium]